MDKKTLEKLGLKIGHFTDLENLTDSLMKAIKNSILMAKDIPGFPALKK